jgi:ribonuclease HI
LINQNRVKILKTAALNPATLLLDDDSIHDCLETLENTWSLQHDLTDVPWEEPDEVLFTDGSSFVINRIRYAGAAVVTLNWTIWAQALRHGTSAQKTELITLTQGLRYGRNKVINVYTDSRNAFTITHVHGALYRERGFLTSESKNIKDTQKILALFEAIWLPKNVTIIHCCDHQKGDHPEAKGNWAADQAARTVTTKAAGPLEILLTHTPALTS